MKKFLIICFSIAICLSLSACCMFHDWQNATCTTEKICTKCNAVEGEALGHDWQDATCTSPKSCSRCGLTEGDALGHWTDNWENSDEGDAIVLKCKLCSEVISSARKVEISIDNYDDYFELSYGDVSAGLVGEIDPHRYISRPYVCNLKDEYSIAPDAGSEVVLCYNYDWRLQQFYGGTEISEEDFAVLGTPISDRIADHYTEELIWEQDTKKLFIDGISDAEYVMFHTCENLIFTDVSGVLYLQS